MEKVVVDLLSCVVCFAVVNDVQLLFSEIISTFLTLPLPIRNRKGSTTKQIHRYEQIASVENVQWTFLTDAISSYHANFKTSRSHRTRDRNP
jgi:hypothetical protein